MMRLALMLTLILWASLAWAQNAGAPAAVPAALSPWLLVGLAGNVLWTNVVMGLLKKALPGWDAKAWAPPLIGAVGGIFGAMAAGQIGSFEQLAVWTLTGIGAGGVASSARDVVVGK